MKQQNLFLYVDKVKNTTIKVGGGVHEFIKEMDRSPKEKIGFSFFAFCNANNLERLQDKAENLTKILSAGDKIVDKNKKGDVVAELHSQSMDKINTAKEMILNAITYSKQKTTKPKLIKKIIK